MADIHIGLGPDDPAGKGTVVVYYHVPVPEGIRDGVLAAYGAQTPVAPEVEQTELDAFAAGALREVVFAQPVNLSDAGAITATRALIRGRWASVAADTAASLDYAVKYYGVPLNRAGV